MASVFLFEKFRSNLVNEYETYYESLTTTVSNSLVQSERMTDAVMLNAALFLASEADRNRNMKQSQLREIRDQAGVGEMFVIDRTGRYLLSTDHFATDDNYNFFNFCEDYRGLVDGRSSLEKTPILLSYPPNNAKPYKFTQIPLPDRSRIVEVAVHLEFIQKTLEHILKTDSNVTEIALFAPSGDRLGYGSRDADFKNTDLFSVERVVAANVANCCQCKMKGLTKNGTTEYFYKLRMSVLKTPLTTKISYLIGMTSVLATVAIVIAFFTAIFITRKVVRGIQTLNAEMAAFTESQDLSFRFTVSTKDEVGNLVKNINAMIVAMEIYQKESAEIQKMKAVARTTQMLAHDVRKPFTMLNMGMTMLNQAKSLDEFRSISQRLTQEVQKALFNVNGMIEDILSMSMEQLPTKELLSPRQIIEDAINELQGLHDEATISIKREFQHLHKIRANKSQIRRVLLNILENAVQAMNASGEIWIKTKEAESFVEFCIGNSGPPIDRKDLSNIFDAFYTKGKSGGTGLGLAIVHKIVTKHGGKIRCVSDEKGTEFYFTLECDVTTTDGM